MTQPGVVDPSVGVPETGNQSQSQEVAATSVDPSTGVAYTSIRIQTPAARGLAQPDLSLEYSSGSSVGYAGHGWTLSVPSIERRPLSGSPNFDSPPTTPTNKWVPQDQYFYQGRRLLPVCLIEDGCIGVNTNNEPVPTFAQGWWYFRLAEDTTFERFFLSPDQQTWVIQTKGGVTTELGKPLRAGSVPAAVELPATRPNGGSVLPYRWYVSRKYDMQGGGPSGTPSNVVYYVWVKRDRFPANQRLYLSDVYDTPLPGTEGTFVPGNFAHHVAFAYTVAPTPPTDKPGPNPTAPPTYFASPIWQAVPFDFISGIDVTSAVFRDTTKRRELVRRYHLYYQADQTGARYYLDNLTIEGKCASSVYEIDSSNNPVLPATSCPKRPSTVFSYQGIDELTLGLTDLVGGVPDKAYLADINSDGLPDFVGPADAQGGQGIVAFNSPFTVLNNIGNEAGISLTGINSGTCSTCNGATESTFFPDPKATTIGFTTGNYLGDGHINIGWFHQVGSDSFGTSYTITPYTPVLSGTAWTWQIESDNYLTTAPASSLTSCPQPGDTDGPTLWTAEVPVGTGDVDGDNYPDLITQTNVIYCGGPLTGHITTCYPNYCPGNCDPNAGPPCAILPWPEPQASATAGLNIYTTHKLYAGSLEVFGNTLPGTQKVQGLNGPVGPAFPTLVYLPSPYDASPRTPPRLLTEDLNGDGLTDIVSVAPVTSSGPAASSPAVQVYYGNGDGTISAPFVVFQTAPYTDPTQFFVHDVSGDGIADFMVMTTTSLTVYFGFDGLNQSFSTTWYADATHPLTANSQLTFGDMNGSGVDDIVIIESGKAWYFDTQNGARPGLLTRTSNGIGGTTALTYASTTDLAMKARQTNAAWQTQAPQVMHHVTSVNKTNGLPGTYAAGTTTEYTYTDPVYDPRDQRFVGFRKVRQHRTGSGDDPATNLETTFLTGICSVDFPSSSCTNTADRPTLPLTSRPVLVDLFDDAGHYLSTVHTTYAAQITQHGTDQTVARMVWPYSVDTFLYDSSAVPGATTTFSLVDASIPDVGLSASRTFTLHGSSPVRLRRLTVEDVRGNVTESDDYGGPSDQPITVTTTWPAVPGDVSGWLARKGTEVLEAFASSGNPWPDNARTTTNTYDAYGDLLSTSQVVLGTAQLNRFDSTKRTTAPAPSDATAEGENVQIATYTYDAYGNRTTTSGPLGTSCEVVVYDPVFTLAVTADDVYTQHTDCTHPSGPALSTVSTYDLGLGVSTYTQAPDGSFSRTTYDGFGRPLSVLKNDAQSTIFYASQSSVTHTYADYYDTANGYLAELVLTQTWDGTTTHPTWTFSDGLGNPLVTIVPANANDPAPWIESGRQRRGPGDHMLDAYQPFFTSSAGAGLTALLTNSSAPVSFDFSAPPTSASRHSVYDGFGRAVKTYGLDGQQDSATVFHQLSTDVYDKAHLSPSSGVYSTKVNDGHGRLASETSSGRVGTSTSITTTQIAYTYDASGATTSITRSSGGTSVVQYLRRDNRGNLVENQEPNSTSGTNDWRYVYNDRNEVVATSDARGCGRNIAYDAVGREVSEDYSPCLPNQAAYSAPFVGASGPTGLEVEYYYDSDPQSPNGGPDGHLHQIWDRASSTTVSYDARGRAVHVTRALAKPGAPSATRSLRYAGNSFSNVITYDEEDRVVTRTTGANALALLSNGKSQTMTSYDQRGNAATIDSSYGLLIAHSQFDADAKPLLYSYGDALGTSASMFYNPLRQLLTSTISRKWATVTNLGTEQDVLEAKTYGYDPVGNPKTVTDTSDPSRWLPGSRPVRQKTISYDDFYHVTDVLYDYSGADSFVAPLQPEYDNEAQNPGSLSAMPATILATRVQHQTFDYDWLGNTKQTTDDLSAFYDRSLGTITNDSKAPNRITKAVGATTSDSAQIAYDAAGNVTQIVVGRSRTTSSPYSNVELTYSWDEVGHLSRAVRQATTGGLFVTIHTLADVTYSYDASGARVLRASTDANGDTSYAAEVFKTLRLEGASWDATVGAYKDDETTESVYLAGGSGEPLARLAYSQTDPQAAASGALHVFLELKDPLGSTAYVVDRATSELVERTTYYPYGDVESDFRTPRWSNFREPHKFSGKLEDIEVGLTYFGGRYLVPALGRWLSPDPVAVHAQKGNLNVYAYARGRVFSVTDPTGLSDGMISFSSGGDLMSTFQNLAMADAAIEMVPGVGYGMMLAEQASQSNMAWSFNNGMANSISDSVNGVSHFFGGKNVLPTFAPSANSGNLFDSLAYSAGNAVGVTLATEGTGLSGAIGKAAGAVADWVEAGSAFGAATADAASTISAAARVDTTVAEVGEQAITGFCFVAGTPVETFDGQRPIEVLTVGDRVMTSDDDATGSTSIDPATWRDVHLRMPNPDGSGDVLDVEILRPQTWLGEVGAAAGRWVAFALPEMGLYGPAEVQALSPIPTIRPGPGRVIRATVTHLNSQIRVLRFAETTEALEPTATHRLYSLDRHDWVPAAELRVGEHLWAQGGQVTIAANDAKRGVERVYNIEVETKHSYLVGGARILSHNESPCVAGVSGAESVGAYDRAALVSSSYKTIGSAQVAPGAVCQYCQGAAATTIDHAISARAAHDVAAMGIMPRSDIRVALAGADNLVGACGSCNFAKGAMLPGNVPGTWLPSNPTPGAVDLMQRMGTWITP